MDTGLRNNGTPPRYDVVVVVTSAGGLEALSTVLADVAAALPAAVVVQQHLGGKSTLAQLLARRTGLGVEWADDGAVLEPGRVLVARPGRRLEIRPDLTVASLVNEEGARSMPHDALLRSVAQSCGERGLAVVLTGMGRDATEGAASLRAAGGVVLAQSAWSAEHPSMPQAAADAGVVDLVLPLAEIGAVVADVVAGAPLPGPDTV
jgi:chemotaxis response regulator CheB